MAQKKRESKRTVRERADEIAPKVTIVTGLLMFILSICILIDDPLSPLAGILFLLSLPFFAIWAWKGNWLIVSEERV